MSRYVATYDIANDRQRERVARVLRRLGHRIQFSVFEIWLDPPDLPWFRRKIGSLLSRTDAFDLIPIDDRPNRKRFRWQRPFDEYGPVVILE